MAKYIYVPASDSTIAVGLNILNAQLYDDRAATEVKPGSRGLGNLGAEASSLYILGHGNWGAGIGTHKTHYGAGSLSRMLINDGLASQQVDLEIHLYACNTGVSGARVFGTRRPYALRLGEELAGAGFNNTKVIGYVGFLSVLSLELCSQNKGGKNAGTRTSPRQGQVVYTVHGGHCTQVGTEKWGMRSTFAWRTVDVVRTDTAARA